MDANRLETEKSPYLREAAHQPVDWHPWGREAFERARKEDKPLLLDIGAQWCHWCHVIDHESYEDADLAELINEHFVPVKVDRDERPDVDSRYQRAVQALTGQGGWPLTAFLTPEGDVFFGGTYFPPRETMGRPSFRTVLTKVAEAWRERRDDAVTQARHLREHLRPKPAAGVAAATSFVDATVAHMEQSFDSENGGFGKSPKFPHTGAVDLAMRVHARTGSALLRDIAETTLKRMGDGGICDQLAGGFHRYSVDAIWRVPHFEKLLYDNAEILRNYAHAHALWGTRDAGVAQVVATLADAGVRALPANGESATSGSNGAPVGLSSYHGRLARHVLRFLETRLTDRERGGYYASEDADIGPDDDGDHFTWSMGEVAAALDDAFLFRVACLHYGIREQGDMHHDPRRNVLHVEADATAIAAAMKKPVAEIEATLAEARRRLYDARLKRKVPNVDRNLYANWNGMAASACLEAGSALELPEVTAFAVKTLERWLHEAWDDERGFAHLIPDGGGAAVHHGFLDDQAQMASALLEAHSVTGETYFLDAARATLDVVLEHYTQESGVLGDVAHALRDEPEAAVLADADVPVWDSPTPAAAAVAVRALDRLARATGEEHYADAASRILDALVQHARPGVFTGTLALALDERENPPPHVSILGAADDARSRALLDEARRAYAPGRVIVHLAPGDEDDAALPEEARALVRSRPKGSAPAAFVCVGQRCLPPVEDAGELARVMRATR